MTNRLSKITHAARAGLRRTGRVAGYVVLFAVLVAVGFGVGDGLREVIVSQGPAWLVRLVGKQEAATPEGQGAAESGRKVAFWKSSMEV